MHNEVKMNIIYRCTTKTTSVALAKKKEVSDIPHCHRVEPTDEIYHRYSRQSRELEWLRPRPRPWSLGAQRKVHTVSSYKRTLQRLNGHYPILSIFSIYGIVKRMYRT